MNITTPKHYIVVVGEPLITLNEIGLDCCSHNTVYTNERFLPNIIVELGIFNSKSEIRKNRKDLFRTLDQLDWLTFKFGHRVLDVVVGQ